jgi:hypothetical protein
LTRTLFYEQVQKFPDQSAYEPQFTLGANIPGLINARVTFLELRDPTGYLWAIKYLSSWEHWEQLMTCSWFEAEYQAWLRELKSILRQEALKKISEIAQGGSVQAFAAAKYLASYEWEKASRKAGAPSKEEMKGELAKAVKELNTLEEDAQRMGLTVIQGGKK